MLFNQSYTKTLVTSNTKPDIINKDFGDIQTETQHRNHNHRDEAQYHNMSFAERLPQTSKHFVSVA